jgi:hypothetical protein
MSRYRLEIRPSVEKTLRKIRDAKAAGGTPALR